MEFKNFIGIDISKDTLDIAIIVSSGECESLKWANNKKDIEKAFSNLFEQYPVSKSDTLICAEYSGYYSSLLIDVAITMNINLWMESPYSILRSQGLVRGKNDKIDAIRIAQYAMRFSDKAKIVTPTPQTIKELNYLYTERELAIQVLKQYKSQLKQEINFIEEGYLISKKKRVKKLIGILEKNIKEIEKNMENIIANDPQIKKNFEVITSIDGIGALTAIATIVATNNFLKFDDPRKFACHIGCAPFRYESGKSLHSRNKVSQKANKKLKSTFHMAALSTISMKGELKDYYIRKVKEGKNKMSVINAIRSKLVHRIFAVVKQERKYEKNYNHSLV